MRLRKSTRVCSGMLTRKGRMASPAGAPNIGEETKLAALATAIPVAAVLKSLRRSWSMVSSVLVVSMALLFVGHFTLDAALEVVTSATLDRSTILGAVDSLVEKSMVATRPIGGMMRYRLLDTTRAYALDISIENAEAADLATRHAV